jgi:hypothetical protein
LVELDSSPPAIDALHDLIVGPVVVIDRTFEQKLRLILWRHLVEAFNFMFREDVGRCRLRLPLQAQKLSDLLPCSACGACTHKKRSQQDAGRYCRNRKPSARAGAFWRERIDLRPRRSLLHAPVGICRHRESIGGVPAVEKITPGESVVTG